MIELYNEDGRTFGPWPSIPNPLIVPEVGAVHCAGLDWTASGWALRQVERPPEVDTRTLAELKDDLCRAVNEAAERERGRVLTLAVGKSVAYAEKAAEARLILFDESNAPPAEATPILLREAAVRGLSLLDMARLVMSRYLACKDAEAAINEIEVRTVMSISAASNAAVAKAAYEALQWPSTQ